MNLNKWIVAAVSVCCVATALLLAKDATADSKKESQTNTATTQTAQSEQQQQQVDIKRLSEAYGHFMQRSLENPLIKLDFDSVIKGMMDAKAGRSSPMTEQEYEEALNSIQEKAFTELANKNLKVAEVFLLENAKKSGVVELESNKLQYMILEQGHGDETVTEECMPLMQYTGKYADDTVFGTSVDNGGPVAIPLSQTIVGFSKGVIGMKEGEKRRLFIHPDLGYGTAGQLQPNALLIFDIEVVKVNNQTKDENGTDTNKENSSLEQSTDSQAQPAS